MMPCRAGHMPFSRNQPAAVTACSSTSTTASPGLPTAAPPASSSPRTAVSPAGWIPGGMIGEPVRTGAAGRWSGGASCSSITGSTAVCSTPERGYGWGSA
ncbi:hypothetical protein GA0115240_14254 [Streptomyces sp. DvalAA-14]|nr:hypothetical protein GA0115240_14254 [Streptomyces sp. DvalAA-14]